MTLKYVARAVLVLVVIAGLVFAWFTRDVSGPIKNELNADQLASVARFIGTPHQASPIVVPPLPAHPFLAAQGNNSMHNDTFQSDTYTWGGPLGHNTLVDSARFHPLVGSCVSSVLNPAGYLISTCVTPFGVSLVARDPQSLEIYARKKITHWLPIGNQFGGGVYFHQDHLGRVLLASNQPAIEIWALQGQQNNLHWQMVESIDIAPALNKVRAEDHRVIDVMPDWQGNYWFITRTGIVGLSDQRGVNIKAIDLPDEGIDNALAVGPNGVFIASNHAMYRFNAGKKGAPVITWRQEYDRGSAPKPGTMGHGTGTTPTLLGNDYVAITDNADGRINVMVYLQNIDSKLLQQVCKVPVFTANLGASENSMVAIGHSLIVENNYGYQGPFDNINAQPGLARIDIDKASQTCSVGWENLTISSPSAVPKVSLANGLIYVYTRDNSNPSAMQAWYFTALDANTGQLVFKVLTGVGKGFNNHYGSISIMPNGTAYVGTIAGVVKVWDQ